ncbi:MAG TPA: SxtJ family membrane protein [Thermoanaerobaculia bacterium]|nr:SxtJ family membrane protein [Thermoanaerobaculia bacterium]
MKTSSVPSAGQIRSLAAVFFGLLVLTAGLLWRRAGSGWVVGGLLLLAALLLALAFIAPSSLQPIYKRWMVLAGIVGAVNTTILLSAIYVLLIIPTGLLLKLFGKDPMERRRQNGTYWKTPEAHPHGTKHFEKRY